MAPHEVTPYGSNIYWSDELNIPRTEYGASFKEYQIPQRATMKWPNEPPQDVLVLAKFPRFGKLNNHTYLVLAPPREGFSNRSLSGIHPQRLTIFWNNTRFREPENKK